VVYDPDEALKPNSPLSGRQATSNETTSTFTRGEKGADFTGAEITLTAEEPWGPTFQHNPIHPRTGIAWFIGDDLYGQASTQNGMGLRSGLASAGEVQLHKAHAYGHTCGGGHGNGGSETAMQMAARLSKKLDGHAVVVRWSRDNHNTMGSRHYNTKATLKIGAKKDGTLVACSGDWYGVGGGASGCWYGLRTTYTIPTVSWTAHNVYCNVPGRGAWRCISDTPGAEIYDPAFDKLAAQLDMNPYELRMKNIMAADAPDQDPPNRVWSGKGINACFDAVYKESGFASKWHKPGAKTLADGRLHGIAITGHQDSHGGVNGSSRYGHIRMGGQDNTGKCFVYVGGAKGSNGPQTQMGHTVAEVLGLKWEDIQIGPWANSDINLDTGNQVGSGHTAATTSYYNASMEMRNRLFERAITLDPFKAIAGIKADDLDANNSEIFLKSDPTKKTTHAAVTSGWREPQIVVSAGVGSGTLRRHGVGTAKVGDACNTNGGAAACAEVAVDPDTGEVEVLNIWNAVDTGKTIFKKGVEKEMGSGCEIMINYNNFYGDVYDPATACILGMAFGCFNHQTAMDFNPNAFHLIEVESDDAIGGFGAHGIGEPCVTNAAAIKCAIFNATGKWLDWEHGSGNASKVLKALGKA
jgi:CO/xanthine dehydrogenase Mo-binding subunit